MTVSYSTIKTLRAYAGKYRPAAFPKHYDVISTEKVTKTFQKLVPWTTMGNNCDEDGFPLYLAGCKEFYNKPTHRWGAWTLKNEYAENRPTYFITITYEAYEIELTPEGKKEVERRYKIHKRNMEKYAKLLG